jgi:hypothetical protein
VRYFLAKLGLRKLSEAVGRVDLLYANPNPVNKKATMLEFGSILLNTSTLYPGVNISGGSVKQVCVICNVPAKIAILGTLNQ